MISGTRAGPGHLVTLRDARLGVLWTVPFASIEDYAKYHNANPIGVDVDGDGAF